MKVIKISDPHTNLALKLGISRANAKRINLGVIYGAKYPEKVTKTALDELRKNYEKTNSNKSS